MFFTRSLERRRAGLRTPIESGDPMNPQIPFGPALASYGENFAAAVGSRRGRALLPPPQRALGHQSTNRAPPAARLRGYLDRS